MHAFTKDKKNVPVNYLAVTEDKRSGQCMVDSPDSQKEGIEMARPRKQTYTMEMYLKKIRDGDIDNNADVQRHFVWSKEQINELIVTVLTDEYIPPIILGEEENSQLHIADGGCRSAALNEFRYGNYKITSSTDDSVIPYKKKNKDENGNVTWEDAVFDIKNKTYEKLPDELKKKFNEYQIETVIHENCDRARISKYIKKYNNHTPMNTEQKAFTYIDRFAGNIRAILDSRFFLDHSSYSDQEKTKGVTERVVIETIMCIYHFDKWKKQPKALCKYLNDNGSEEEFNRLAGNLHRLEYVITDDIKHIFNKKDSFIFLTLFDKFTKLGFEDAEFAGFLRKFQEEYRPVRKNEKGLLFDEIDKDLSTKDKTVIVAKLDMLEKLMTEYLHISMEEKEAILENQAVAPMDIVKGYMDENVTDEDMELYEIIANDVSEAIEDIDSEFLSESNRPSFVALVACAVKEDTDYLLGGWLSEYEKRKEPLILNQKENFLQMKKDFERFVVAQGRKSA
jgi:Protein of unknown function DUF262.